MKYEVSIPEVHYAIWSIEAASKKEAIELALQGEGDEVEFQYSHTDADNNNYKVKELEN